jgi:hypothetical protein
MYGYKEYIPLYPEEILKRVTEEDIFSLIIKEPIIKDKGAYYKAPYRIDSNPDCYFETYNGTLTFVDFADTQKVKNCFGFLQRTLNLTFLEVLHYINSHFSLGLGDSVDNVKKIIVENDYVEEEKLIKSFKERTITFLPREFNYKDKEFWLKYGITKQNLIEDKVIPIKIYRSSSRKGVYFSVLCSSIAYAYTDFTDLQGKTLKGKVKIYRPYEDKLGKWFTNCNQNDLGSLNHLPKKGDLLIITKAYKDCRVLRNQNLNSCWTQAEGMLPNVEILTNLCKRFKYILVWFDNDNAGITNSRILVELLNSIIPNKAKSIMLPPNLLLEHIKDPSDLYEKKGKENLINFLKIKKIINI